MATVSMNQQPRQIDPDFRTGCGIIATIIACIVTGITAIVLVIGAFETMGFLGGIFTMLGLGAFISSGLMWIAGNGSVREGIRWTFS